MSSVLGCGVVAVLFLGGFLHTLVVFFFRCVVSCWLSSAFVCVVVSVWYRGGIHLPWVMCFIGVWYRGGGHLPCALSFFVFGEAFRWRISGSECVTSAGELIIIIIIFINCSWVVTRWQ